MKLSDRNWKEFYLSELFEIESCKCSKVTAFTTGNIPYAGATNRNNGVISFINAPASKITKGNCIIFICDGDGSIGYNIYKKENFVGSTTLKVGRNKHLNKYVGLFITTVADRARNIYDFGYKRNSSHLKNEKIYLPMNSTGQPDYEFMEAYMREKEEKLKSQYKQYIYSRIKEKYNRPQTPKEWKEFTMEEIAEIKPGKDIYENERKAGNLPYISSTAQRNGIGYWVENKNETLEKNCLSVNRNGSVGYSFFHPYNALFSNDCRKLKLKYSSKYIGLYISNVITNQRFKYGYGYKMGTIRLKKQKIMLPVTQSNEPDYQYMENYMKYLEQQKLLEYLKFIERK